ncbi:class I SAM-dependent methyltransferase [Actinoplanes sp. TBRC 11911]|uniref:class I SAM-dependent methyltransferase n=1 Tax=Actinoplanes sp. TBRC 11911 TaxID=2729386 RepID=UPI00145D2873|nr:class I SAM-dependent methyltransferase [Actinoplanes sp. TBRC 11911]NMO53969.1 class I SAM-dependent methyltransferase [Actinoplanes sp. TBRC 11911]
MPPTARATLDPARLAGWRASWTSVMAGFVPGMPRLEAVITATVDALRPGPPARIMDVGGGPGVLAERLSAQWPDAHVTLVDIDPVLLALARGALPGSVAVIDADLTSPGWAAGTFDLITAVMTVHYLGPREIRAFYREARRALAPGGVLVVADLMPDAGLPSVMDALDPAAGEAAAELAWAQWWGTLAETPALHDLLTARTEIFRRRPPSGFVAESSWHLDAAREAGFGETGVLWREGRHAALAARAAATGGGR